MSTVQHVLNIQKKKDNFYKIKNGTDYCVFIKLFNLKAFFLKVH